MTFSSGKQILIRSQRGLEFPDPGVDSILDVGHQGDPDLVLAVLPVVVKLRQFELEHVLALRGLRVEHVRGELLDRQPYL